MFQLIITHPPWFLSENKMKDWRPRIREGQVSIRRQRRLFVVVCRNGKEADVMEKSIIKTLVKERK